MSNNMSLHRACFNKNSIKFKSQPKRVLPPTCDTIIKNLINNPLHHLGLINQKNITPLFKESNSLSHIKLKKLGSQLTKNFSAKISSTTHLSSESQLVELLNEIDNLSVGVDGSFTMQPIVVESDAPFNNSQHKLFAGQKRITNIYMILKYLESDNQHFNTCKSSTDLLTKHFLETLSFEAWDNYLTNINIQDSFLNDQLSKTYQTLHSWFSNKPLIEHEIWKKKLLNHTKFIWYITDTEAYESEKMQKRGGMGIEAKYLS